MFRNIPYYSISGIEEEKHDYHIWVEVTKHLSTYQYCGHNEIVTDYTREAFYDISGIDTQSRQNKSTIYGGAIYTNRIFRSMSRLVPSERLDALTQALVC